MYKSKLAIVLFLALTLVTSAFAQQARPSTPPPPTETPAPTATTVPAQSQRGPDYVDSTGFKGKVFDVKHRAPRALVQALHPLGSGFKGATMQYSDEFKTITVRDFPENIATVEDALKRLDTPQTSSPDIELRMNILIASNVEGMTTQVPNDLADVVKQMQAALNYKTYTNVATVLQRVSDGAWQVRLSGGTELPAGLIREQAVPATYSFNIPSVNLSTEASGGYSVQLKESEFGWNMATPGGNASIRTSLSVRSGEKVVVGTATLGNKGLILVLSAKASK